MKNITYTMLKRDNGDIRCKTHIFGEPIQKDYPYRIVKDLSNDIISDYIHDDFVLYTQKSMIKLLEISCSNH